MIAIDVSQILTAEAKAQQARAALQAAVKAEAQRRIIMLTGVSDLPSCLIKQLNANMRAAELNDKRVSGAELTEDEEVEAAALRALAASIKHIRARSDEIEAMEPIPPDYMDDAYWT